MGMDLQRNAPNGYFRFSNFGWGMVLDLAQRHGWQPAGTAAPAYYQAAGDPDWSGGYLSNDGQTVTAEDARAIAGALEKALAAMPDSAVAARLLPYKRPADFAEVVERFLEEYELAECHPRQPAVSAESPPEEWFAADRELLLDFIDYCRQGEFAIL